VRLVTRTTWFSALTTYVLVLQLICAPVYAQDQPAPTKLNIVILEGEGAINSVRQRVAREPVVQVEDENHKPIGGAAVTFDRSQLSAMVTQGWPRTQRQPLPSVTNSCQRLSMRPRAAGP